MGDEVVILWGPGLQVAEAQAMSSEGTPNGRLFTLRTSNPDVSHFSSLRGREGKFEIVKAERCGGRWIVEGKRLDS